MKRFKNILILLFVILFILIVISGTIKLDCIFKKLFNISCPGCGLTRSFRALLRFNIILAFKYNVLGPVLFITVIVGIIFLIKDIIKNEDKTVKWTYKLLSNYYYIVIICLITSMIINNIRGI